MMEKSLYGKYLYQRQPYQTGAFFLSGDVKGLQDISAKGGNRVFY